MPRLVHADPAELPFLVVDPLLLECVLLECVPLEREAVPLAWFFAEWWPFFCQRDPLAGRADPFAGRLAEGRASVVRRAMRALPDD